MSLIHSLPPELVDHIIDQLHDDRISLRACSRVCRQWLYASQYHLFRERSITLKAIYPPRNSLLISLAHLVVNVPGHLHNVKALCLTPDTWLGIGILSYPIYLTDLLVSLHLLPNLHTLELNRLRWSSLEYNPANLGPSLSIRKLVLRNTCVHGFQCLEYLIQSLRNLVHLELISVSTNLLPEDTDKTCDTTIFKPHIETLKIQGSTIVTGFFQYFHSVLSASLVSLDLGWITAHDLLFVLTSLPLDVCAAIKTLRFGVEVSHPTLSPSELDQLHEIYLPGFSRYTSLRSLTLLVPNSHIDPQDIFHRIIQHLPKYLHDITFHYEKYTLTSDSNRQIEFLSRLSWEQLERNMGHLPKLQAARFCVTNFEGTEIYTLARVVRKMIQDRLPVMHRKNIIKF